MITITSHHHMYMTTYKWSEEHLQGLRYATRWPRRGAQLNFKVFVFFNGCSASVFLTNHCSSTFKHTTATTYHCFNKYEGHSVQIPIFIPPIQRLFKNVYTLFSAACGSNKSPKTQPTPSTEHQGPTQNPELRLKRHNPNPAGSFSQTHYYY